LSSIIISQLYLAQADVSLKAALTMAAASLSADRQAFWLFETKKIQRTAPKGMALPRV